MGEQETIKLFDIPSNEADLAKMIAMITKLDETAKNISGISIFGKTSNATEARQQQQAMATGMEQIAQLQQKMIELENQLQAAKAKGAGGKAKTDEEIRAMVEASEARRQSIASIKDQIRYNDAETDSMVRKRIELKQIKAEYIKLGPEKQAMESGRAMITQMKELSDELLKQESSYGQFGRNVGNYSGALKVMEEQLAKTTSKMSEMESRSRTTVQNLGAASPVGFNANQWKNQNTTSLTGANGQTVSILNEEAEAYQKAGQQAQWLNTIIQKQEAGFSSVSQRLRTMTRDLVSMKDAGLEGTEAFAMLEQETIKGERAMKEQMREYKLLESETPALKALTLAAKGLAGAYAIGAGSVALFADGNEKVEKEMNKMIAIMTILQGLQEAWELLQQKGAALKALNTAATAAETVGMELFAAVTGEATASMTALDAAMIMSGIGALIVALGGLIYLLSQSTESTKEYYEAQGKLNEQLKEYYDAIVKANEALDDELKRTDDIAKKKIEIQEINARSIQDQLDLNAAKKKAAEEDLARNRAVMESLRKEKEFKEYAGKSDADMQDDLQGQYDERLGGIKALQSANKENNEQQEKNKQYGSGEDPRLADEIESNKTVIGLYQKQADAIKGKLDRVKTLNVAIDDSAHATEERNAEDEKFAHELYERKVKALTEISNLLRAQSADYLGAQTTSPIGEGSQMKALEAERMLRERIVKSNMEQELRVENLTGEERQLIRVKANDELIKLEESFIGREAVIRYNGRQQDVNEEIMTQAELLKIREQFYQKQEDQIKNAGANQKSFLEIQRDEQLQGLLEQHTKKDPTGKDDNEMRKYGERKLEIETESNNRILQSDEDTNRKQIALNNVKIRDLQSQTPGTPAQKQQQQKAVDDLNTQNNGLAGKNASIELQIATNTAAQKHKIEQDTLDKKIQAIDLAVEAEKQAQATVDAFVNASFERQVNLIDRQIRKNNELKETETARIQNSTLAETAKAVMMERLAIETDQKNKALEREKQKVAQREAEFNRAEGILNVGINTAVAIMKAVASSPQTGGLPFSAIAAAIGAAQIAAILAKPIPKYEVGTDYHPGGPMIVHPGEMRVDPSGQISMTPDKETLTFGDPGTKIIPKHRADMMNDILLASIFSDNKPVQDNRLYDEVRSIRDSNVQMSRDIVAAIKKQKPPETHVHVDTNFLTYIKTCL